MMLFQKIRSYVFDFERILINNRRKKSQECGVLDFFTEITNLDRLEKNPQQIMVQF